MSPNLSRCPDCVSLKVFQSPSVPTMQITICRPAPEEVKHQQQKIQKKPKRYKFAESANKAVNGAKLRSLVMNSEKGPSVVADK